MWDYSVWKFKVIGGGLNNARLILSKPADQIKSLNLLSWAQVWGDLDAMKILLASALYLDWDITQKWPIIPEWKEKVYINQDMSVDQLEHKSTVM